MTQLEARFDECVALEKALGELNSMFVDLNDLVHRQVSPEHVAPGEQSSTQ